MQQAHAERNCAESYEHPVSLKRAKQREAPWKGAQLFKPCKPLTEHSVRWHTPCHLEKLCFCLKKKKRVLCLKNTNKLKTTGTAQRRLAKDPADPSRSSVPLLPSCGSSDKPIHLLEPLFQYLEGEDNTHLTRPFWGFNERDDVKIPRNYFTDTGFRKRKR